MRQGQPKRLRGRNRGGGGGGSGGGGGGGGGGGKGPNPLTRSYESNGPDVKIRGTASTIADKYVQLSRDALTSGDPVAAENYMQHAEHYYRLLAAAQAQYQPHQTFVRADDYGDGDGDEEGGPMEAQPSAPQHQPNGQPYNDGRHNNGPRPQAGGFNGGRDNFQPRRDEQQPRRDEQQPRRERDESQPRREREEAQPRRERFERRANDRPERAERADEPQPVIGELPAFITGGVAAPAAPAPAPTPAPVHRQEPEVEAVAPVEQVAAAGENPAAEPDAEGARAPARGRRRRYGRFGRGPGSGEEQEGSGEEARQPSDTVSE